MKKSLKLLALICCWLSTAHGFMFVDFDSSMKAAHYQEILNNDYFQRLYEMFKIIYDSQRIVSRDQQTNLRIPKIIHHVWLGSTLPEEYEAYYASWRQHHPDWIFIFWTDNEANYDKGRLIKDFDELQAHLADQEQFEQFFVLDTNALSFDNKKYFDASNSFGERSDILKWEIVYRFGGVYVDTDFECLKPLDELHYQFDFYTGIQPLDTNRVQLGAALYGAQPKHAILKRCVEDIEHNQHIKPIVLKTGPLHFTNCFFVQVSNQTLDIALPCSYLYPCSYEQKGLSADVWQCPESYAVHHWAGSWLKPSGFVARK